jgi:transcriptional regulator with XRE-family HTH domain
MTQLQLALMVGVGPNAIAQYESGARKPNILMLKKLARALHTTTDALLESIDIEDNARRVSKRGDTLGIVFRNIRAECARNALTIEELSNKLGIERKTFYNWEDKKDLPVSYLVKMSNIFHVSTDELLSLPRTIEK